MTDFITHSNGTTVDVNHWDAWDVENHRQAMAMMELPPELAHDPEEYEEIKRHRREQEACKAIGPIMLGIEQARCIDSIAQDANLYFE